MQFLLLSAFVLYRCSEIDTKYADVAVRDILSNTGYTAKIISLAAIIPSIISLLNFTAYTSILSKLHTEKAVPSPGGGVAGILVSLLSIAGSLASIWSLLIYYYDKI